MEFVRGNYIDISPTVYTAATVHHPPSPPPSPSFLLFFISFSSAPRNLSARRPPAHSSFFSLPSGSRALPASRFSSSLFLLLPHLYFRSLLSVSILSGPFHVLFFSQPIIFSFTLTSLPLSVSSLFCSFVSFFYLILFYYSNFKVILYCPSIFTLFLFCLLISPPPFPLHPIFSPF